MNATRDAYSAGLSHGLEAGRDIDAVTVQVVTVDDDVALIDTHSELDAQVLGDACVALPHRALDERGTANRVQHRCELGEKPVARGLDDAALALRNCRINKLFAVPLEAGQGARLVGFHLSAETSDIRDQNGGEPALFGMLLH